MAAVWLLRLHPSLFSK